MYLILRRPTTTATVIRSMATKSYVWPRGIPPTTFSSNLNPCYKVLSEKILSSVCKNCMNPVLDNVTCMVGIVESFRLHISILRCVSDYNLFHIYSAVKSATLDVDVLSTINHKVKKFTVVIKRQDNTIEIVLDIVPNDTNQYAIQDLSKPSLL